MKKISLWIYVFLLSISFCLAVVPSPSSRWTFDDADTVSGQALDTIGTHDGIIIGATTGITTCPVGECYEFDGVTTNESVRINNSAYIDLGSNDFTISMWVNWNTVNTDILWETWNGHDGYQVHWYNSGDTTLRVFNDGADGGVTYSPSAGQWVHIVLVRDGTNHTYFVNGTPLTSFTFSTTYSADGNALLIGGYEGGNFDGYIDEVCFWNVTALNNSAVQESYNNSRDGISCLGELVSNFTITAVNNRTGATINTFNATINGSSHNQTYNTTTGTITTSILDNSTDLFNITVRAVNFFNNETFNYNVSSNYEADLIPYTIVNASDSDGNIIFNFTVNYTQIGNSTNTDSIQSNSSSGQAFLPLFNASYTIIIYDAFNGSLQYASNESNRTASNYLALHSVTLYATNSFNLIIRDEQTRELIDDRNVTIRFISSLEASEHNTTNGTLFISALMPAEIEIRYSADDYNERSYYHFMNNQTFNNITLYLLNSSEGTLVIATHLDESGSPVNDVISILRRGYILNGVEVFETVEMDKTDFGGEGVFFLELNDVVYRWLVVRNVTNNQVLFSSTGAEVTSNTIEFTLEILGDPLESYNLITGDGLSTIITTNPTYDNSSKTWNASFTISQSNIYSEICLSIDQITDFGRVEVNESCTTSNTATLSVGYNNDQRGSIATLKLKRTGKPDLPIAIETYEPNQNFRNFGSLGVFVSIWLVSTLGLALISTPATLIIGGILGIISSVAMGFLGLSWVAIIPLIITGGVIIFNMD